MQAYEQAREVLIKSTTYDDHETVLRVIFCRNVFGLVALDAVSFSLCTRFLNRRLSLERF